MTIPRVAKAQISEPYFYAPNYLGATCEAASTVFINSFVQHLMRVNCTCASSPL